MWSYAKAKQLIFQIPFRIPCPVQNVKQSQRGDGKPAALPVTVLPQGSSEELPTQQKEYVRR